MTLPPKTSAKASVARKTVAAGEAERERLRNGLPHLFGFKWYAWAKIFFDSTNRMNILCAANQISKSSTQIRKYIHWATSPKKWPELWPTRRPRQFWVLYPTKDVATAEWHTKIEPEFMPRNEFKTHPVYGWTVEFEKKQIFAIHFNSGITIYFKAYTQDVHALQSGTVDAIFCFPAGTQVLTPTGTQPIEKLRVGDWVIAGDGSFQRVLRALSRDNAEILTRTFEDGRQVRATPEHPFWTLQGRWVPFKDLTSGLQCGTVPEWELIRSLSFLRASYTAAFQVARTLAAAITSVTAYRAFFMSLFGKPCTADMYQKDMSCTTGTGIRSTIARAIWSFLHAPSMLPCTNVRNGSPETFGNSSATSAGKNSSQEAPKTLLLDSALKNVDAKQKRVGVFFAEFLSRLAQTLRPVSVRDSAPIVESGTVYNLEVDGPHTYFANGFLVHNCDEELPEELLSELQARLYASEGYFHMVFTATRNQLLWLQAIEGKGTEEKFPDACKMQISMFDCQFYLDGTPGHFTEEKIRLIRAGCRNKTEELRRVWGRFVRESGRCISEFNPLVHFIKPVKIPKDWLRYTAIDNGSGGDSGHPGAFSMLAVRPDLRLGYFYHCWRGDGIQTTAGDIIDKWVVDSEGTLYIQAIYDYASKDLSTIAERQGIPLVKAEKSHELGEDVLNTLFKNNMLFLFDTPELRKMGVEFMTVMTEQPKRRRKDDLSDTARYVATAVPWDWSALQGKLTDEEIQQKRDSREWTPQDQYAWEQRQRRGQKEPEEDGADELDAEFDFWNQAYGN